MPNIDEMFANLRRPVFVESPNSVPQEVGSQNGNIAPTGWLEDNSVSADVIQANAVIAAKISAGAIETDKLAANAVTAAKIAANTITGDKIAANTITAAQIAANTITSAQIAANTITAAQIQANSITANEIAANAVTVSELSADSVTTNKIVAANVTSSRMEVSITGKNFGANSGTSGAPGFFFDSATDTGLSFTAAGLILLLNVGGSRQMSMTSLVTASSNLFRPGADNVYGLGDSANRWTEVWSVDGTINTSDATEKRDIADSPLGLDFIRSLRPRTFRWKETHDTQAWEEAVRGIDPDAIAVEAEPWVQRIVDARAKQSTLRGDHPDQRRLEFIVAESRKRLTEIRQRHEAPALAAKEQKRPGRRVHYGLIAQEVKEALDAHGVDAAFWKQSSDGLQSLSYSELLGPVIKSIQELAAENQELRQRLETLEGAR